MNRQMTIAVTVALIVGLSCGAAATYSWLRVPQSVTAGTSDDRHDTLVRDSNLAPAGDDGDDHEDHGHDEDEHGDAIRLTQKQIDELEIEVKTAGPGSLHFSVRLPGEVILNADAVAHIVPRAPGIVREVLRNVGDIVRTGDVMAWIESAELGQAKVDYLAKWAALDCSTVDLARAHEVHDNTIRLLEMLTSSPTMETLRGMNGVAMGDNRSALVSAYAEFIFSKTTYLRERALFEKKVSSEEDCQAAEAAYKKADALYAATRDSIGFNVQRDLLEATRSQRVREIELKGVERRLYVLGLISDDIRDFELLAQTQTTPRAKKAECNDPNCRGCVNDGPDVRHITGADLAKTDERLAWYPLRAPFDGTVIEKHLTLGEKHGDDSGAFTIADLSSVWVDIAVYQKDLAYVQKGMNVRISAGAGMPSADGVIAYVSPVVDEKTRTAMARVVLPNSSGEWRPGLFVSTEIAIEEESASVVVPKSAIQRIGEESVVFLDTIEGLEPVPVSLGRSNASHVEVLSGLAAGQRYVAQGGFELKAKITTSGLGAHAGHGH